MHNKKRLLQTQRHNNNYLKMCFLNDKIQVKLALISNTTYNNYFPYPLMSQYNVFLYNNDKLSLLRMIL